MASVTTYSIFMITMMMLLTTAHSQSCKTQKLGNSKTYSLCSTLPSLDSELHYTYNATNASLSIAFIAKPSRPGGWISWSLNPTSTGMVGAQAFIAYEFNKSIKTTTLNITGYRILTPGNLSFNFWDVSAEKKNDVVTLYASLTVPGNKAAVNQVWQVGPGVDATGAILPHAFSGESLLSKSVLSLTGADVPSAAPSPAPTTAGLAPAPGGTTVGIAPGAGNETSDGGVLGRVSGGVVISVLVASMWLF